MRDFLQRDLEVGDYVVFTVIDREETHFCVGIIKEFTKNRVRIEYMNRWNGTPTPTRTGALVTPTSLLYIAPHEATAYKLRTGLI